ncbi:MAG: DUF934 domain-containing protein [Burkholderiaceae bacterium]|jgi:uncharacterized protein (DUF934 family)|nr:DUF934 domain-containing protein [Burkholderiaceae bacterium]
MSRTTAKIIRNNTIVRDNWLVLRPEKEVAPERVAVPKGKVVVPLGVWKAQRQILHKRSDIGVWLASDERPEELKNDLGRLKVIAVDFPRFADGRGYSIAFLLRDRLGYTGEIRAIGDVLRDQIFYLSRVGFDAFSPRADRSIEEALKGLGDFSVRYQASWDEKLPLFRRVQRKGETA